MIYLGTYSTSGITIDGLVFRNANATRLAASTDPFESTIINANTFSNYIQRRVAGALYIQQGLNCYFNNIVFEDNDCENRGAGIYINGGFGLTCSYYVTNSYFVNNFISQSTYGVMSNEHGNIYCYNTVFHNNRVGNFQ
ncbi:MAG: hypothetical protein H7221_09665 [Flavobacterium sp.]|nr:hypothetical protein [Flavobacterium sp.]